MKKVKQAISWIVTLSFCLIMFVQTTSATACTLGFSAGVVGTPGDTVSIDVVMTGDQIISSSNFDVSYSATDLDFVAMTAGSMIANCDYTPNQLSAGSLRFVFATGNTITGTGTICTIKFKIKSGATIGTSSLSIGNVVVGDQNGSDVGSMYTPVTGSIAIKNAYTTSFNANGGTAVADATVTKGNSIAAAPTSTKSGYVLDGWYTSSNTKVSFPYTPAADSTLTAVWKSVPVNMTDTQLTAGKFGTAYSQSATATGGSGSFKFSIASGNLPSGLSLADNGTITGTPSAAGNFSMIIKATDTINGEIASAVYGLTIDSLGTVATPTASVGSGKVEKNDTVTLSTATSGATIYYTLDNSDPTASSTAYTGPIALTSDVTVKAIAIQSGWTSSSVSSFSYTINKHAFTYSVGTVTSGTAPTEAAHMKGDIITVKDIGTVTKTGYVFKGWSMNADGSGALYTSTSTLTMGSTDITLYAKWQATPITFADATLTAGTYGTAYTGTIAATGGSGAFTYAITSGALPTGVTMNTAGTLTGMPTVFGNYTMAVQATDTNTNLTATANFTLAVSSAGTVVAPATSVKAGGVDKGTAITLTTTTDGATIYFTTDGTTPTASSTPYTKAITLNANTTIKAIAVKYGWTDSTVSSFAYTMNAFNVIFSTNGGSTIANASVLNLSTVTQPADPVKAGYAFGGWYSDSACKNAWTFATDKVNGADVTLYAKWYLLGDINMDGVVNSLDVRTGMKAVAGTLTLTDIQKKICDIDCNGSDNSLDIRVMMQVAAGMIR